jgi:NADH-quinone oxidoreductase subunit L
VKPEAFLFSIPLLPFLGFLVNGLLGRRLPRSWVSFVAVTGPALAFVVSAWGFAALATTAGDHVQLTQSLWTWLEAGSLRVPFAFAFDRLAAVMCLVVTGVGTLIHVYSIGYMREDPGYARFFAYLNLFMAAMLVLVLADNLVLLFLGWEGVGLCSYLLIGFWYRDLGNCSAGIKAFVVNRIGDLGFLLGIFWLYSELGTFVFDGADGINSSVGRSNPATLFAIALLLFLGATGKSAQIPLYVWLPDAMAGPTPVSALIHAATMVTSGVYMVARLGPLFDASGAGLVIAAVGGITALLAAAIAFSQHDIKKVLAYSTISQLGYMFLAAGVGAYAVAIFHVVTHAFFKALLFLGAGAVIHSLDHEQDMRRMGGLRLRLPQTFVLFVIGALALAGFPLTAGFFSKDEILHEVHARGGSNAAWLCLWLLGLATAFLTAVYTFRQVVLVFLGEYRGAPEPDAQSSLAVHHPDPAHGHRGLDLKEVHEAPLTMRVPLYTLAVLSLLGGAFGVVHFLSPSPHEASEGGKLSGWILGGTVAVAGIACALALYLHKPQLVRALTQENRAGRAIARLSGKKFYVDEIYDRAVVRPLGFLADFLFFVVDRLLIDVLLVRGSALLVRVSGHLVRRLQTGRAPTYALWLVGGALGVLGMGLWLSR